MARFVWAVGGATAELTLTEPLKFRGGSLGRARTRYRSISLDQRTSVTELLTPAGADVVEGRVRFIGDPSLLSAMVEDAASGSLLTYEHSNGIIVSDLLLEDAGPLTEIVPDENRYGFGEWERTLRLRHVGDGSLNLITSPESFDDTATWGSGAVVTANTAIAPDRTASADDVEDDSAVSSSGVAQSVAYTSGDKIVASLFVKKQTNGPTLRFSNGFSGVDPGASVNHRLNPENGATNFNAGVTELDRGVAEIGDYWMLWHAVQSTADHDTVSFSVAVAIDQPGLFGTDVAATGSQVLWGARIATLDPAWTAGNSLPAYVPNSKRVLWQLFPPVTI